MEMLNSTMLTQCFECISLFCLSLLSGFIFLITYLRKKCNREYSTVCDTQDAREPTCYPPVESLSDFNWEEKAPVKIRPFKPRYNLTMSIQDATISELIEIDRNYLDRITLRKKIMEEHPETVLGAKERVRPVVDEFYTWLVGNYLPTRYPRMFQLHPPVGEKPALLHNLVTDDRYHLVPKERAIDTLRDMGGLVEDDLLFLMPSEDGDGLSLEGFVTCFPNGFDTSKKLNLKLRDIHKPVPQYKERLEKSMDRFFNKLKVGKVVKRANWTIQNTDQLFTASGNHLYDGEEIPKEELDINVARVRVERQFLHRLPRSRALLFSFKTLLYTLPEIKEEGLGEALAEAIDGLRQGNAPEFYHYKRAAVWGESAKAYLRANN